METEMEQRQAEIRRQKLEMKQLKILVENQRNVEVAELQALFYQSRISDDELSNFGGQSSCQNLRTGKPSRLLHSQTKTVTFQACGNPVSTASDGKAVKVSCPAESSSTAHGFKGQSEQIS